MGQDARRAPILVSSALRGNEFLRRRGGPEGETADLRIAGGAGARGRSNSESVTLPLTVTTVSLLSARPELIRTGMSERKLPFTLRTSGLTEQFSGTRTRTDPFTVFSFAPENFS